MVAEPQPTGKVDQPTPSPLRDILVTPDGQPTGYGVWTREFVNATHGLDRNELVRATEAQVESNATRLGRAIDAAGIGSSENSDYRFWQNRNFVFDNLLSYLIIKYRGKNMQ